MAGARSGLLLFVSLVAHFSCEGQPDDSPETNSVVLAPFAALAVMAADDDPLTSHRPSSIDCNTLTGWYSEDEWLEVNTAECNYLSLFEPAAADASEGDVIVTEISHFDLTSADPAEAHVALVVRDVIIWERAIPIPSPANVLEVSVPLPINVKKGDPVGIHLHNHGQNTWNLLPIAVVR